MRGKTDSSAAAISRSAGRSDPGSMPVCTTRKLKILRYREVSASTSFPGLSLAREISATSAASRASRSALARSVDSPSATRATSKATCHIAVAAGRGGSSQKVRALKPTSACIAKWAARDGARKHEHGGAFSGRSACSLTVSSEGESSSRRRSVDILIKSCTSACARNGCAAGLPPLATRGVYRWTVHLLRGFRSASKRSLQPSLANNGCRV